MSTPHRYTSVRNGGQALARLAPVVQAGVAMLGLAYFLNQAQVLLSDAQFTWAERRIAGLIALTTVVGFGLAGWVLGTTLKVIAGLLDVLADQAEASWRTVDLMEIHVLPALGRIAARLDADGAAGQSGATSTSQPRPLNTGRVDALQKDLAAARADEDVDRALELRDELTQHLRGEALRTLDADLAGWIKGLVEARAKAKDVDWEVARWVAHAVDSLGDEPEAAPLRAVLPEIRRRAGLCHVCGRAVAGGRDVCGRCAPDAASGASPRRTPNGEKDRR
ncbi:hypothetical protein [Paludisphaera rhizosphaerae]|uniref:hypothetical protein n=1 Tax=Paludisphaera rhizosphaerae TaxID=2711216 RepID=UPI0013EA1F15|nr:hypothetical protein [Paludisphaera rhizosphaerae]